ncbi:MAG: SagB/ThcOx family dehydrogenase [Candidatus Hydrothermarchaeota archaeon]
MYRNINAICLSIILILPTSLCITEKRELKEVDKIIMLPEPRYTSNKSVEEAILERRSIREYSEKNLSLEEISQILWAAQGITYRPKGFRTAPSAGALYPMEIYVVTKEGIYHYDPWTHSLEQKYAGDVRKNLSKAALDQEWVREAPVDIIITAVFERTKRKYGERGERYVYMEAGHVAQNIYLQCVSLNLGTTVVGAFYDDEVQEVLKLPSDHKPIYIMPVGHKR